MNRKKKWLTIYYPMYYKQFSCIGDRCEGTCCTGWKISIDPKTLSLYKKVRGPFGKRLKSGVNFKEKRFCTEKGSCPMLNSKGLCDIYLTLGEDKMCYACRVYPRHAEDYGRVREIMILLSCPEAARRILGSRQCFSLYSRRRLMRKSEIKSDPGIMPVFMKNVFSMRAQLIRILCSEEKTFDMRLKEVLNIALNVQRKISIFKEAQQWEYCADVYVKEAQSAAVPQCFPKMIQQYMDMLLGFETVTQQWPPFLKKCIAILKSEKNTTQQWLCFERECADNIYMYENLAIYYLYVYFAGCVFDEELLGKVKLMFFNVQILHRLHYAMWLDGKKGLDGLVSSVWIFARQLDHSDTNLEALETLFCSYPLFSISVMNSLYF